MTKSCAVVLETLKLISVEPYLFLTTFGLFLSMVPLQSLLIDRACHNTLEYPDSVCQNLDHHKPEQEKSIEVGNNLFTGVMISTSLPAIVVAIFIGPWSDKYSRKWPLGLTVSGLFVESLALVALTYFRSVPPQWFIVVSLISGMSGSFLVCLSSASSYLSDITDERSRSTRFAVLDCFYVSASVVGSVMGGQIFKAYGYLVVLSVAPGLYFCALLYVVLVVKETKPPPVSRTEMFRDLFRLDNIKQSYTTCTKKRHGNIRLQIWLLIFVDTSVKFVIIGTLGIGFVFAKQMYKMGVSEFSNVNTVSSLASALVSVLVMPLFTKTMRLHEAAIGLIGILSFIAKMVLISVAHTTTLFYFALMSGTLYNCAGIAVQSRLSKIVAKEELGRAFSLLGTFSTFAPMLGTATFLQVYNVSLSFYPGLTFAIASIFLIPSALILGWMMKLPTISIGSYAKEEDHNEHQNSFNNLEEKF